MLQTTRGGVRVVCETLGLPQSCVGVYLPLGSRRVPAVQLAALRDACAGTDISVAATRDVLALTHLSAPAAAGTALARLADVLRGGPTRPAAVAATATAAAAAAARAPPPLADPDVALPELLHRAAYGRDTPLGAWSPAAVDVRALPPATRAAHVRRALAAVRACRPRDVVVAAAGPDVLARVTPAAVDRVLAPLFRGTAAPAPAAPSSEAVPAVPVATPAEGGGAYRGGKVLCAAEEWRPALAGPRAHLAHVGVCFGCGTDLARAGRDGGDDVYALRVAGAALGGGTAFSEGGPGKGMLSRLYTRVLAQPWAEGARAVVAHNSAGGLLGAVGACAPAAAGRMVAALAEQLVLLAAEPLGADALARAQHAAACGVALAVEHSAGLCEDLGTQTLLRGRRDAPRTVAARIAAVRAADVQRVARRALATPPAVAGIVPRAFCRRVVPVRVLRRQVALLTALFPADPAQSPLSSISPKP